MTTDAHTDNEADSEMDSERGGTSRRSRCKPPKHRRQRERSSSPALDEALLACPTRQVRPGSSATASKRPADNVASSDGNDASSTPSARDEPAVSLPVAGSAGSGVLASVPPLIVPVKRLPGEVDLAAADRARKGLVRFLTYARGKFKIKRGTGDTSDSLDNDEVDPELVFMLEEAYECLEGDLQADQATADEVYTVMIRILSKVKAKVGLEERRGHNEDAGYVLKQAEVRLAQWKAAMCL